MERQTGMTRLMRKHVVCGVGAGLAGARRGDFVHERGGRSLWGSPSVEGRHVAVQPNGVPLAVQRQPGRGHDRRPDAVCGLRLPRHPQKVTVNEGGAWFFFGPGTAATQAYAWAASGRSWSLPR